MSKQFDLVVLGTGGAGYQVAANMKKEGWDVAVVDKGPFGGTCSTRGCIPKKVLAHAAEVAEGAEHLRNLGIVSETPSYNWSKLIDFKRTFTDPVSDGTQQSLKDAGITVYQGDPRFIDKNTLEVNNETIKSERFHIATGAKPMPLDIPGAEHMLISDDFLELETLPASIIFVGGGYIGFEFAHIAARFGANVTILEAAEQPLRIFDTDIVNALVDSTRGAGIDVVTGFRATEIKKDKDGYQVTDGNNTYEAEAVIHGAGRVPSIDNLNLEAAEVEYDARRGVTVDEYLTSVSNPHVTSAGDAANSGPPLTPVSGIEGSIVTENLKGNKTQIPDYNSVVSVIFSVPRAARVGMLEQEATEAGFDVTVSHDGYGGWFDAKKSGFEHARFKIIIEKQTDRILGAHVFGPHAEEVANMFGLAIANKLTVADVKKPTLAFPTSLDDSRSMLP